MKILYAIQGTGNGHIARAEEIIPQLVTYGKVDLFISGAQADIQLPYPVKYRSKGLSFYFGKQGGIDFLKTFKNNNTRRVIREIRDFPVTDYDLVINDFEAITAWACRRKGVPCIALSHQFALLSKKVPKPKHIDPIGSWFLGNYAPTEAGVGFHFKAWDKNMFTPVIRERIRTARASDKGHYTVYLPAYSDEKITALLKQFPNIRWHVFSKHTTRGGHYNNIRIYPIDNEAFIKSLVGSTGVLCGAGFETPAESLYLHKKLLVVPMKSQYEQHFNAAGLKQLGVPVMKKFSEKHMDVLQNWVDHSKKVEVSYAETAGLALERVFQLYESRQALEIN